MATHLNCVVSDVEMTGSPAQVSTGEVAGALFKADHVSLIQPPAGLHHELSPEQLQSRIHLEPVYFLALEGTKFLFFFFYHLKFQLCI